jgi:ribosomal protein S12 methylthiotransferase accessory factor
VTELPAAETGHRGPVAAIVGHGLLATAISAAVGTALHDANPGDLTDITELFDGRQGPRALVTASDGWDIRAFEHIQALCLAAEVAWLPVRVEPGRAVIGPIWRPGAAGCITCAELRRSLADDQWDARQSMRQRYERLTDQPSPWLTGLTARTVAALTAADVLTAAGRTAQALLYVDLDTLAVSRHRFLPDPLCPTCGGLPDDSAEAARIVLRPRPKPEPGNYRVHPLGAADLDRLRETYVDTEAGLIRRVQAFPSGGLAVAAAAMRTRWQSRSELSWGRTLRHRRSEIVAVLEAVERYGGMVPGGRRGVVRASFADVRDTAVDPRTLGLYPAERYDEPGFAFQPFEVDRVCRWVWGFSFARAAPILIPQAYAYYRAHATDRGDPSFAYEISNGCALGSCLEEAILYGILEVVERDAFLLTWYARLPATQIDLSSARDRSIPMLAKVIEAEMGYRLHAFDITMEHRIPAVWVLAVSSSGGDRPALACSAGAHLDPEQAASGALSELGPILADLVSRYTEIAERGRAMAGDSALVTTMDDHSVLYTSREAAPRLDFLARSAPSRSFAELEQRCGTADAFRHADLTEDLAGAVGRLRAHGLDVIVVDQTTPEHRLGRFSCVKVIVPGTLPMTFGQANRRVHGLPRLFEVPRLLGYRDQPLSPEDINPHPHPFP